MFSEGGSCKKLTFIVSGEMDTPAATEFGKEYRETMSETLGITKLTLDLTGLDVIVSSALSVLLEMARDMNGKGTINTFGVNDRVISSLAEEYQQLYLCPGGEGQARYDDIVKRGRDVSEKSLSHFCMDAKDKLEYLDTPAGCVLCVTLNKRRDFVTFLQIMANRCEAVEIPDTQGASLIDGVISWTKIKAHKKEFFKAEADKGTLFPDWSAEFKRFTSDKRNYLDAVIVLSAGPYNAVSAERLGLPGDEWIALSDRIRKYHECTHFVCRRLFPKKTDAVWDELVADAVGIYAAFGKYDPKMEELFLGIEGNHYIGGRLENYIESYTKDVADSGPDREAVLSGLAVKISGVIKAFDEMITKSMDAEPFEIAFLLEGSMNKLW